MNISQIVISNKLEKSICESKKKEKGQMSLYIDQN